MAYDNRSATLIARSRAGDAVGCNAHAKQASIALPMRLLRGAEDNRNQFLLQVRVLTRWSTVLLCVCIVERDVDAVSWFLMLTSLCRPVLGVCVETCACAR